MIAEALTTQHGFPRNAKQCRDRYSMKNSDIINFWINRLLQTGVKRKSRNCIVCTRKSAINGLVFLPTFLASIPFNTPRNDNCVKNHFYSKLRKALRHLNKSIKKNFKKQFREIKIASLYKIIETLEEKFRENTEIDEKKYLESLSTILLYFFRT